MQVIETRFGLSAQVLNAQNIARLKLLPIESLLYLATPEEMPVSGAPHTVNKYGIVVTRGAPLTELRFPVGGCTMQETSQQLAEGGTYDLELTAIIPRNEPTLLNWLEQNKGREWLAIWLDQNGFAYVGGEQENGLAMNVSRSIREANSVALTLRSRYWHSVYFLESFDSADLFADAAFDHSFSISFDS